MRNFIIKWFTDARARYSVIVDKIYSRWIYPHKIGIDTRFDIWDPKSDSYLRKIFISLAGSGIEKVKDEEVVVTIMNKTSVSSSTGLQIPIVKDGPSISVNVSGAWESQNTISDKKSVRITYKDLDRECGSNTYSFFGNSPITDFRNNNVYLETTDMAVLICVLFQLKEISHNKLTINYQ